MSQVPLVSVLMPAYNHESYVAAAIESVMEQSYPRVELLICDDCSPDGTAAVLRSMAGRYPERIKLHLGRKNRGVASRFNYLCRQAAGNYIAPFASDDKLPRDAIEKRIRFLEQNPAIDVLVTNFDVIDKSGRSLSKAQQRRLVGQFNRLYHTDFNRLYESLLFGNFIPAGTLCFRMQRIEKQELFHDEHCPDLHDYDVWLMLARKYRWGYLDDETYLYRWHDENFSSPRNRSIESWAAVAAQSIYILSKQLLEEQTRDQRKYTLENIVKGCNGLSQVGPQLAGSTPPAAGVDRSIRAKQNDPGAGIGLKPKTVPVEDRTGTSGQSPPHGPYASGCAIDALVRQGKRLLADRRLQQACDTFIQVLDNDPGNLQAIAHLGLIALQASNTEQAKFFFDQAMGIDPSCKKWLDGMIQSNPQAPIQS